MESYLVIGGGGFLGRRIVELLLEQGETKVAALDLRKTFDDPRVNFITGDITKLDDVVNACKGVTTIIHTAAVITGNPALIEKVNVGGTKTIIKACLQTGVKKLIYTSSASVVFAGKDLINVDESTPYCKVHFDEYNRTKNLAEVEVINVDPKCGLLTCSIRPSGIFGPGDQMAWPGFIKTAKEGKSKLQVGDGKNKFDWTYVDNVAHAHLLAAKKLKEGSPVVGQIYFITNDEPIPFWDMANYAYKGLGYETTRIKLPGLLMWYFAVVVGFFVLLLSPIVKIEPTFTPLRIANVISTKTFNINKAKRELGYKPIVPLKEGMKRTLDYFLEKEKNNK